MAKQWRQAYRQRIPSEGKFGQGKNGYRLNVIRVRTAGTSQAWIQSIFLVMNLLVLAQVFMRLSQWRGVLAILYLNQPPSIISAHTFTLFGVSMLRHYQLLVAKFLRTL